MITQKGLLFKIAFFKAVTLKKKSTKLLTITFIHN